RPVGPAPVRAELEVPPLAPVARIDRMLGRRENERTRLEHVRQRAGIILRLRLDFREGDVAGRVDELAELTIGDRRAVDPEAVNGYAMRRGFLGIVMVRPHAERAAGDDDHAVAGYLSVRGTVGSGVRRKIDHARLAKVS